MKVFVFMYPYVGYFVDSVEWLNPAFEHGLLTADDMFGINRLVIERYRANGFQVVWVFHGKKSALHKPTLRQATHWLEYQKGDMVISSGTRGKHPNCEFILNQLPKEIELLVVGGFHWQFCPRELAEYADSLGIRAEVDEDTTQAFFPKLLEHRIAEGNKTASFPVEGIPFVPYMGAGNLEDQVELYQKLERWPFLVRNWDQENYSLRNRNGTLTMPREAFHKIFS